MRYWKRITAAGVLAIVLGSGCTTGPEPEATFLTDYRVVDDRTVKYMYLIGERSLAGTSYSDQGLAVEICSIDAETDEDTDEEQILETDCERTRILKTEEYR